MAELNTVEEFQRIAKVLFFEKLDDPQVSEEFRVRSFGACPMCAAVTDYRPVSGDPVGAECQWCYETFPREEGMYPPLKFTYRVDAALTNGERNVVRPLHDYDRQRRYFVRALEAFIGEDRSTAIIAEATQLFRKVTTIGVPS